MGIFKFFYRKEKEEKKVKLITKKEPSELQKLCGEDKEVYEALSNALLNKPPKEFSIEKVLEEADQKERVKDFFGAGLCHLSVGQFYLFKGDVEGVKKHFSRCKELTGRNYLILKIPERAVAKAQEYYRKLFPT